jgi:hypothetical protein
MVDSEDEVPPVDDIDDDDESFFTEPHFLVQVFPKFIQELASCFNQVKT